jgi:2'-hydroxyisoflavone reductase
MNILVIGGTRFVGRGIVDAALQRAHTVTLFNRGVTGAGVFPDVPRLTGDRRSDADVAQLSGTEWDCVVDVSAYRPAEVRPVLHTLGDAIRHYVYVSTVSVYADPVVPGATEDAPLLQVGEDVPAGDRHAYGGLKAACEVALRSAIGDRLTVLRPTVVVGPHDYTDRFTWWVRQIAEGGRLQVPRNLDQAVQLIDVRDLGAFAVHAVEERLLGTFNTVGPERPLTLATMIGLIQDAIGVSVELVPTGAEAARFPLLIDDGDDGAFRVSGAAAYRRGLALRPLTESARDVLA